MEAEKAIKGTVTISLEDFEELKGLAKKADKSERMMAAIVDDVMAVYGFDDVAYSARLKEIDEDEKLDTDKKIRKAVDEAMCLLNITVNTDALKRLFQKYIDKEQSENHADLEKADKKQLAAMQIILQGQLDGQDATL